MCNDGYTGKDTIQGHLRGTVANYGWVILSPVANDDFHEYRSFQWSDSNYRPYLTITYYYAPSVSTGTASGISTSKATLNGNITSVNGANCSVRGFQYGLSRINRITRLWEGRILSGLWHPRQHGIHDISILLRCLYPNCFHHVTDD